MEVVCSRVFFPPIVICIKFPGYDNNEEVKYVIYTQSLELFVHLFLSGCNKEPVNNAKSSGSANGKNMYHIPTPTPPITITSTFAMNK